jgi:hypothetical protein
MLIKFICIIIIFILEVGGACLTRMEDMKMLKHIQPEHPKIRDHLEDLEDNTEMGLREIVCDDVG